MLIAFLVATIASYYFYGLVAGANSIHQGTEEALKDVFSSKGIKADAPAIETSFMLLLNNSKASLVAIVLGFIPILILPYLSLMINGMIIGLIIQLGEAQGHSGISLFLYGLLPHGVTELSALLLAGAMGSLISITLAKKIFKKSSTLSMKELTKMLSWTFLLIIIPLLIFSAIIEGFITPQLLEFALK